ncbi:hypothetical protein ABZ565_19610 [Streptomyces sp. NPDC016469]|uniref:hypothetical protein n=1 Tax=Streptomyces sp. NPDC016469 TaxID=3157191 RepID=UPI0033ED381B
MRQFSVPVRWAAVTAVTLVTSTGCMSVGSDGAEPAPSRSAEPKGAAVEPNGSTVTGTGRSRFGGAGAQSERRGAGTSASASPSGSAPAAEGSRGGPDEGGDRDRAARPPVPAGPPEPAPPEASVPADPDPVPGPQDPADTPAPPDPQEPGPEPSESAPPVPSASPAAQFRTDAMGWRDGVPALRTPEASPQVGPV